jgi:hypothetical protein
MSTKKQVPGTYTVTIAFSVSDIGGDTEALDDLMGRAIETIENTTGAVALMPRAVGGVEQFDTDTGQGFHYHAIEDVNDPDFGEWRALYGDIVAGEDTVECDRDGCHERLEGNEPAVPIVCWHCFKAEAVAERLKNGAQENLQAENAELKRKLAEAEKALAVAQRGLKCRQEAEAQAHRTYHDAMDKLPVEAKYLHDPAAQPADMMARMVARAESAERKCAELSEALRDKQDKRCDALAQLLDRNAKLLAALREAEALAVRRGGRWDLEDQVSHERIKAVIADAALASQPAPEGKVEKGKPTHGEIEIAALSLLVDEAERILFAKRENGGDHPALALALSRIEVRRLHKLTTPEAKPLKDRPCECCGIRSDDDTEGSAYCGNCDGGLCAGPGGVPHPKPTPEAP